MQWCINGVLRWMMSVGGILAGMVSAKLNNEYRKCDCTDVSF